MNSNHAHADIDDARRTRASRPTLRVLPSLPTATALQQTGLEAWLEAELQVELQAQTTPVVSIHSASRTGISQALLLSVGVTCTMICGSFFGYYLLGPVAANVLGLG